VLLEGKSKQQTTNNKQQTNKQSNEQPDKQTNQTKPNQPTNQPNKQTNTQLNKHTIKQTEKQTTNQPTNQPTNKQPDRRTDRQTDRDRQTQDRCPSVTPTLRTGDPHLSSAAAADPVIFRSQFHLQSSRGFVIYQSSKTLMREQSYSNLSVLSAGSRGACTTWSSVLKQALLRRLTFWVHPRPSSFSYLSSVLFYAPCGALIHGRVLLDPATGTSVVSFKDGLAHWWTVTGHSCLRKLGTSGNNSGKNPVSLGSTNNK